MRKTLTIIVGLTLLGVLGCTLHVHLWGKYYTPEEPCLKCESPHPTTMPSGTQNPDLQYIYDLSKENP